MTNKVFHLPADATQKLNLKQELHASSCYSDRNVNLLLVITNGTKSVRLHGWLTLSLQKLYD